jgi:hypothetical protein
MYLRVPNREKPLDKQIALAARTWSGARHSKGAPREYLSALRLLRKTHPYGVEPTVHI